MSSISKIKLGIIGGGQLGKMLTLAARSMGIFHITILDPEPNSPAGKIADNHIVDKWNSKEGIYKLAELSDIITYEVEHTNVEVLKELEQNGKTIRPSPKVLEIINNKLLQKQFLLKNKLPTAKLIKVNPTQDDFKFLNLPVVQKTCKGGYDGRGVLVIEKSSDIKNAFQVDSFIEEKVDIEKELAILVARGVKGEIRIYPLVEMYFNKKNICDIVVMPAIVSKKIENFAKEIAIECVKKLNGIGIFAIEMFLDKNSNLFINEISPRVHNSGHYTIEAVKTSQFEQHLRAISCLPLGSTEVLSSACMLNLLGEEGYEGEPIIEGLEKVLKIDGVKFHFYEKPKTFPYRKMGHITVLDETPQKALKKVLKIKKLIKVKAKRG